MNFVSKGCFLYFKIKILDSGFNHDIFMAPRLRTTELGPFDSMKRVKRLLLNLSTKTTLWTPKLWPLLTCGCCSEVTLYSKCGKLAVKIVVVVYRWPLSHVWLYFFRGQNDVEDFIDCKSWLRNAEEMDPKKTWHFFQTLQKKSFEIQKFFFAFLKK